MNSILGTPTEDDWPGVTTFPDFKSSFPKWVRNPTTSLVSTLDEDGLDLLEQLLIYDPAGRLSAKQAQIHPYFADMPDVPGVNKYGYPQSRTNGFH
jgi:cyclin-dependent kinase